MRTSKKNIQFKTYFLKTAALIGRGVNKIKQQNKKRTNKKRKQEKKAKNQLIFFSDKGKESFGERIPFVKILCLTKEESHLVNWVTKAIVVATDTISGNAFLALPFHLLWKQFTAYRLSFVQDQRTFSKFFAILFKVRATWTNDLFTVNNCFAYLKTHLFVYNSLTFVREKAPMTLDVFGKLHFEMQLKVEIWVAIYCSYTRCRIGDEQILNICVTYSRILFIFIHASGFGIG